MVIGKKIRDLRTSKGFSQLDMAAYLEISEGTYRSIENNQKTPDIFTVEKIAKFLGKSFLDLLPDEYINFYNNEIKGGNNAMLINQTPDKLIEQYEERIKELKENINDQKEIVLKKNLTIMALNNKVEELLDKLILLK